MKLVAAVRCSRVQAAGRRTEFGPFALAFARIRGCHLPLGGDWASLALHISMLLVVLPILLIVVISIVMIVITKHKLRELVL